MAIPPLPAGSPGTFPTFGGDFAGVDDLDPNFTYLQNTTTTPNQENLALAQAIARRLQTPRGALFYDSNYGYDLRDLIGGSTTTSQAIAGIEDECRKDERIDDAQASINVIGDSWQILITCQSHLSGPFSFTLQASKLTVSLLTTGNA